LIFRLRASRKRVLSAEKKLSALRVRHGDRLPQTPLVRGKRTAAEIETLGGAGELRVRVGLRGVKPPGS